MAKRKKKRGKMRHSGMPRKPKGAGKRRGRVPKHRFAKNGGPGAKAKNAAFLTKNAKRLHSIMRSRGVPIPP
jgi:hypothetical protein